EGGQYLPLHDAWPAESAIFLLEPISRYEDEKFVPTLEPGIFLRVGHAIVAHPTPPSRWGVESNARWIEVNAKSHMLLIREGQAVRFATLVSVGNYETPRGKFRIVAKHVTLGAPFGRPPSGGLAAEVPDVLIAADAQDRRYATALYGVFWLRVWGVPNGGSGIALSPLDARRVFDFAAPELREGWHSVRGDGTWLVIHD